MKPERRLQLQICQWLKLQYPNAIFFSSDSGEKKSIGLAMLAKRTRSSGKLPDLFIAEARGGFFGLFVELKIDNPYNKAGKPKTPHVQGQEEMLDKLINAGYQASFGVGKAAFTVIEMYMKLPKTA